jgi:O-antigen ligase
MFTNRVDAVVWRVLYLVFPLYLLFSVFFRHRSETFAALMVLIGILSLGQIKSRLEYLPLRLYEKRLLLLFFVYSAVSILIALYWPFNADAERRLLDDVRLLVAIPLFFILRSREVSHCNLFLLFAIFALAMLSVSLSQYFRVGYIQGVYSYYGYTRPSADVNPMRYAVISLVVASFVLNFWLVNQFKSKAASVLFVIAAVGGLIACILTQTRGVWLAIPLLFLLYACCFFWGRRHKLFLGVLVLIVLVAASGQHPFVEQRINTTTKNLERYIDGDNSSSLGVRLDMYKASFLLLSYKPFIGHGLGAFKEKSKEFRGKGIIGDDIHKAVGRFSTPHNEFFQALVEKGVVGLVLTIFMFLVPGLIFYRALRVKNKQIVCYGLCGISMLTVYFVAGQTGTLFNHNILINFYIVMTLLFIGQIRVLEKKTGERIDW